jgi:SAM-dependent methyltransferase
VNGDRKGGFSIAAKGFAAGRRNLNRNVKDYKGIGIPHPQRTRVRDFRKTLLKQGFGIFRKDSKKMSADSKLSTAPAAAVEEFSFGHTFGRHWRSSVRYYGLRHTVAQLAGAAYRFFREFLPGRRKAKYGDLDYDFAHSVDTTRANVGFRAQLIAALNGHQYFPTEPWIFEQMMEALQSAVSTQHSALSDEHSVIGSQQSAAGGESMMWAGLEEFTFVDLGSGKGRVLLMAAQYGFKRIIGVEFMPEWHRVAQENVRKFTSAAVAGSRPLPPIESTCMDARDFDFPPGRLVVYLFNPFPEPVLAEVLDRLRESLEKNPRPLLLAYRFPEFDSLIQKTGWLSKIAGTEQWVIYRDWQS